MVVYHFLVDLEMIFRFPIGVYRFPLVLFARVVAAIFILLVGISVSIRYEKAKNLGVKKIIKIFAKRSFYILFWASVITVVTFLMFRDETIVMGILHFIGISMILVLPFLFLENIFLVITAVLSLGLGAVLPFVNTTNYWLLPFGVAPKTFSSFDYFPLFPWFGVIILGIIMGRIIKFKNNKDDIKRNYLEKIGQKSLLIYLLHQPILWSSLWILSRIHI